MGHVMADIEYPRDKKFDIRRAAHSSPAGIYRRASRKKGSLVGLFPHITNPPSRQSIKIDERRSPWLHWKVWRPRLCTWIDRYKEIPYKIHARLKSHIRNKRHTCHHPFDSVNNRGTVEEGLKPSLQNRTRIHLIYNVVFQHIFCRKCLKIWHSKDSRGNERNWRDRLRSSQDQI